MQLSSVALALAALIVAVFTVRHAVDAWLCGNDVADWVRLAKQLLAVVLVAGALRLIPLGATVLAVLAAAALLGYSQFMDPGAELVLDGVVLALAVVAAWRAVQ